VGDLIEDDVPLLDQPDAFTEELLAVDQEPLSFIEHLEGAGKKRREVEVGWHGSTLTLRASGSMLQKTLCQY
jgi:hypothetical protein